MNKIKFLTVAFLLLSMCSSLEAQTKKKSVRPRARSQSKTTKVETPREEKQDTITAEPIPPKPQYKSLDDPMIVRYLRGGFAKDKKLHLITNTDYESLSVVQKQEVIGKVAQEFVDYDIDVYSENQQRELWTYVNGNIKMIESWNNDSLQIERYLPLELKRQGLTRVFYYIGGMFSGSSGSHSGSLSLRAGSYLYENYLDASATFNMGYNTANGNTQFAGDIGIDSRVYLPFRIKKVNLAPYAGVGVSWSFAPSSYFEARFLAGGCWFVGPGSFDIGLQYGIKSDFALTLGYTFRIPVKKKKK